jgi:hypothetical protein
MRPPQRSTPADEVDKLGRFDAEIHMRTSVSALAELMVRIHSPPAGSLRTIGVLPEDFSDLLLFWPGSRFGADSRAEDFENLAETLVTFVTLASIQLALRRLARA